MQAELARRDAERDAEWADRLAASEAIIAEQARSKGLEEGHSKGLEEGHSKGLEEGHSKGLKEGRKEGRSKGLKEGRLEALRSMMEKLISIGWDPTEAAEFTGLK